MSKIKELVESQLKKFGIKFEYKEFNSLDMFYNEDFILKYDPQVFKLCLHLNMNLLPDETTKIYDIIKKIQSKIQENLFMVDIEIKDVFLDTGEEILYGESALTYTNQDDIIDVYDDILITNTTNLLINCDVLYGTC